MAVVDNRALYAWTFSERAETGSDVGFNEPMKENFKKHPYASLIREAIQNSLDVPLDPSKPVEMKISIKSLNHKSYPTFFEITDHIRACKDYYSGYQQADQIYSPMLSYLDDVSKPDGKLHYIQVSDYNTTGMTYIPSDTSNAFYAFVRAAGVSFKQNASAGGSFGFGKAAYFYLSAIRTLFVSTMDKDGNCYFEGVSSLCTHRMNGNKVEAIGFYDCNGGVPVQSNDEILSRFRRKDAEFNEAGPGTDINIMGIDLSERTEEDIYNEMKLAVLRNFWLAIYEDRLIVTIGDCTISKDTLVDIMESSFEDYDDNKRNENYNPRPYLEAVRNAGTSNKYMRYVWEPSKEPFYSSLEGPLGDKFEKIELYLFKSKQGSNRVLYMRSPRMLVERKTHSIGNGFYGVFVATGGLENKLLRLIENPAHDEWNYKNISSLPLAVRRVVKQFIDDYKVFVTNSLTDFFRLSSGAVLSIKGLDQYLYIPTDVDSDEDDEEAVEAYSAEATGEVKDDGTSITTTPISFTVNPPTFKGNQPGKVVIKTPEKAQKSKDGDLWSGKSDHPISRPGSGMGANPKERNKISKEGKDGNYLAEVPVNYRCFAQAEGGKIYHNVIIHSDYEVESGQVHFVVGGDESTDVVKIIHSSDGTPKENAVVNISLHVGKNVLKIRFADNLKHSIKLTAYENK